jgi:hypothetical protein
MKKSRFAGNSVDLFEFTYGEGEGDVYRYCNAERPVGLSGETFAPLAIERDAITKKAREAGSPLNVKVPRTSEIAQLFQGTPPRRVVFLRIFEGDIPEFDSPAEWDSATTMHLVWSGRILEATHKGDVTILSCDTLGAGMKRPGLRRYYQRECGHVLYGTRCQANKTLATFSYSARNFSSDPRRVHLPANWMGDDATRANFIGGLLEWDGPGGRETRVIKSVTGNWIDVDSPVTGLISDYQSVDVILGCQRTLDACAILHDNTLNFGGQPFIQSDNPHGRNNHT